MQHFLLRLVIVSLAVLLAATVFDSKIRVERVESAVLFALVLGLCNVLIRPVLLFITCPFNLLTLGLFTLIVNALVFWTATYVPVGVQVTGFEGAFLGALTVSVVSLLVNRFLLHHGSS